MSIPQTADELNKQAERNNVVTHTAIAEGDKEPHGHHSDGQHPHGIHAKLSHAIHTVEGKIEDGAHYVVESVAGTESGSAHEVL